MVIQAVSGMLPEPHSNFKPVSHPPLPATKKQENSPWRKENEGYFVKYQEKDLGPSLYKVGKR